MVSILEIEEDQGMGLGGYVGGFRTGIDSLLLPVLSRNTC